MARPTSSTTISDVFIELTEHVAGDALLNIDALHRCPPPARHAAWSWSSACAKPPLQVLEITGGLERSGHTKIGGRGGSQARGGGRGAAGEEGEAERAVPGRDGPGRGAGEAGRVVADREEGTARRGGRWRGGQGSWRQGGQTEELGWAEEGGAG
ncbi:hypothetical protein BRADI_2g23055v3 [Brachypodium distachyon]|uniref:Uncharacterized protein n=1 Tax=Brachypodium distachyon TaxID=15368 RepID=A0A0Q3G642_BRADI|nr:hypothetical protein BRADI_2g23055v3 [Brachypodium distachyon]